VAKLPEKVGKYKILSLIGKGGMGVVYAAEHPTLKRKVILKKLTIRDKEFRERFRLEADTMMDLQSDYIVDIYDHFREGSSWYIVMEFIEGISLEELIRQKGPLDYNLFVYIMYCIVQAIDYIHKRGIIHRDIKPSNIYISRTGDVKLGDFGIASSPSRDVKITDSGSAMGTPSYMAPEQFDDSSTVDNRADIFSLGVTFYEALSGIKPFSADNYTDLKQEIRKGKYKKFSLSKHRIPLYLKLMIMRCLYVRPSFRYRDMNPIVSRFSRELRKIGTEKTRALLVNSVEPGKKQKSQVLTRVHGDKTKKNRAFKYKITVAISALIFLISFFYFNGAKRFILAGNFGGFKLTMVPAVEDGRYTIYAIGDSPEKKVEEGSFNRKGEADLILREGSYKVKIESGSHINWRSVYIPDFKDSKGEEISLTVLSSPLERFPLDMSYSVRDRFSGDDITTGSDFFIRLNEKWELLTDTLLLSLKTGTPYNFKITHRGYRDNLYSFETAFYQTSVNLDILLSPASAFLIIPPYEVGILRINNSDEYFSLKTLRFEKLRKKSDEKQILELLPGKYFVTFESEEQVFEKSIGLERDIEYSLIFE